MGINSQKTMSREERITIYSGWLWQLQNQVGMNIACLLNYVLYGSNGNLMWQRLFEVVHEEKIFLASLRAKLNC